MSLVLSTKAAQTGLAVGKQVQKVESEMLGYDFIGLGVKILVFQLIALLLAKYIELVIGTNNILKGLLSLVGFQAPNFLPQAVVDFYTNGYHGVKYWDVIKVATIILILVEMNAYVKSQKALGGQASAFTLGIFALFIGFMLVITVPELVQRLKDFAAVTTAPAATNTGGAPI